MIRRVIETIVVLALLVGCVERGGAQHRVDRFPAVSLEAGQTISIQPRSSYWMEGALLGAAAGVVVAILAIDTQGDCTLGVPGGGCETTYVPRIIGSVLLGIGGAFLGGMLGASVPRASDHGG